MRIALAILLVWTMSPPGATLRDPVTWWADGLSTAPTVSVEGGQGGVSSIEDDGAGGLRVVVWAQGDWRRVRVDGAILAERWRVALPLVRR